jgi:hypothetical protein
VLDVTDIDAADRFPVTATLPVLAKNSKLVGAVRIKVNPLFLAKSALVVSVITILPRALYTEGNPEHVVIDKLGFVIVTCAFTLLTNIKHINNNPNVRNVFLKDVVVFFMILGLKG